MIKNYSFKPKTVLIGLSGGVDSAVAAKLLMMTNFNVYGVYLRLWHENKTITQKEKN
jgi:tRNA-specific 2-thiouridylase